MERGGAARRMWMGCHALGCESVCEKSRSDRSCTESVDEVVEPAGEDGVDAREEVGETESVVSSV